MKDGGPAFPINGDGKERVGLTIRDYFAAHALSIVSKATDTSWRYLSVDEISKLSWKIADAMLKQREVDTEVGS